MAATQTITGQSVLRPAFAGIHASPSSTEVEAWMPSEVQAISPLVEQLMQLIEASCCIVGNEFAVELALREAVSNAVIHGNRMDPNKLVEVHCRCERGTAVWLIVRDHGQGFDSAAVFDPRVSQGQQAEHGRGIFLMKMAMDEVSFKRGGTEVHMWKGPARKSRTDLQSNKEQVSPDWANSIECDVAPVGTGVNAYGSNN